MTEPENLNSIEKQLAAGFVVGNLAPEEALEFERLLKENPELAVEVESLQETLNQVISGLNEVKPPQHLKTEILAASNSVNEIKLIKRHSLPWRTILGSVAALLILWLGVDNYRLRHDLRLAQDVNTLLQHSDTRLFPLQGVNAASTASGSFVLNLEQQKGVIAIQNLPAPPPGRIYRLWAIVDGDKIPCGQLKSHPRGKFIEKFSMPADFYDAGVSGFIVTIESSIDNRYPAGPLVIKSSIR
ncbi:anti-sigma factor [Aetokthonos hydrillicola Thurmond2011]|jgi:hypothetical protein|uniref:Regulator of SigK n=1 Tax=Aetokthonos hydrillicola Thurmond2011 TaxID=2712845 RepID=A0AAP5I9X6_9CYAN|nr:anti-sigma factor [Aetokthonos hydrillicola]MBO3461090.1 hypothetical protein [Aetokthonos hydrillicola CCALA 1050]MBW4590689.1 anti-sigma factor [Aetokthonos hydrillicola CCALA 1050]MDR9897667.1 anti-sigma factor [Aetokthonos hydrillicola Thurmond2011]